jgi:hypothetical protein
MRGTIESLRLRACECAAGECCPDFSCCRPDMAAPLEERKRIAAARLLGEDLARG